MNKIDLHIHSKYSLDGEKEVNELLTVAKNNNVETIAICDHNTAAAYKDLNNHDINIIPGIELDCSFKDHDFHLLGYFIDPINPIWDKINKDVEEMERTSGLKRLEFIRNEMDIKIDMDKLNRLCPNMVYPAESICEVALSMKENDHNKYLEEFRPGKKHGVSPYVDFFWEYCAKGKIAYYPMEFMSMEDAIKLYRSQNALVVLAHPGNNVKEDEALLDDIINLGIDGLEVFSSYHSDKQNEFYLNKALQNNLIITCGSDYHGKTKPHIKMGECKMPKEYEEKLIIYLNNYKENQ